jgi:hypothetical protein
LEAGALRGPVVNQTHLENIHRFTALGVREGARLLTGGSDLDERNGYFLQQSSANTFKEQGQAAVEFYTRTKTIYVGHG